MLDISKRFGGLQALHRVSIDLQGGEVLGLCGANGAGKSTLIRILAGVERPDEGRVLLDGAPVGLDRPQSATELGLSFVHQELNLVPKFTGLQNMALGAGRQRSLGLLDLKALRRRATEVQDMLGYSTPLDVPAEQLTVSDRWMVSLGRSLMRPAHFVAMDEPTASFTSEEAQLLYDVIARLTAGGVGVLYVSHRLEEVLRVCDDVTVLRDGRLVGTYPTGQLDTSALTQHIVGRAVQALTPHSTTTQPVAEHPPRLVVQDLQRPPSVLPASFVLREGEILGIAGLVGSGRTELARLLVGADSSTAGTMTLNGELYRPNSPHDAIRAGVALVPEERRSQGLILTESVQTNLALATHGKSRRLAARFRPRLSRRTAQDVAHRLGVKTAGVDSPVEALSGGNQQKVLVGNYVRAAPSVLILDEPTVGVDVGARAELYEIVGELADAGTSVLLISSDFDELVICDRVLVMRQGELVADLPRQRVSKDRLTRLCFESDPVLAPTP